MKKFKVFVTVTEKNTGVVHWNKTILVLDGDKNDLFNLMVQLTFVKKDVKEFLFDDLFHKGFVKKINDLLVEIEFE